MTEKKHDFNWHLERARDLHAMSDDTSHALATMALRGAIENIIEALSMLQPSEVNKT